MIMIPRPQGYLKTSVEDLGIKLGWGEVAISSLA
jgi:hypothetical protein